MVRIPGTSYGAWQVWFCLFCDDQEPWKAQELQACPTCKTAADVTRAVRFGNMDSKGDD